MSHFWFFTKWEQSLVRNLMARDKFWLLSNNSTLVLWLKKSQWNSLQPFSLEEKEFCGHSRNSWKIPKMDGNLAKGKELFLLVLFTLHVKSYQSVWCSGAPAKSPLRLPQVLLPWRSTVAPGASSWEQPSRGSCRTWGPSKLFWLSSHY